MQDIKEYKTEDREKTKSDQKAIIEKQVAMQRHLMLRDLHGKARDQSLAEKNKSEKLMKHEDALEKRRQQQELQKLQHDTELKLLVKKKASKKAD